VDSWYLGFSSVFFFFCVFPVLSGALFDVFCGLRWVCLGSCWSSWRKRVNCGFWRTSGMFRGTFGVDLLLLGFSFIFGFHPVLVVGVLRVLGCPFGFVRFSFVIKIKGTALWVLEKIR